MTATLRSVTEVCFLLGYLCAWGGEVARLRWPWRTVSGAAWGFAAAGFLAHSVYLLMHHPTPATPQGALLVLAWLVAAVTITGAVGAARQAWVTFALPVVLALVGLSLAFAPDSRLGGQGVEFPPWLLGAHVWKTAHGLLLLAAAAALAVGFLSGVMYLVQARRLRSKLRPTTALKLLSLERLERLGRRSVAVAFPLLSGGLLLALILVPLRPDVEQGWLSVKVLGTVGLWVVCGLLLYLRHLGGAQPKRLARLSIVAFALMVAVLSTAHPYARPIVPTPVELGGSGGGPT